MFCNYNNKHLYSFLNYAHIQKCLFFCPPQTKREVILFFIKSWPWEFLWGKGLFMKVLNHSKLFSWFTASKWTILACRFCCWLNAYRHSQETSALLQCSVVKTLQLQFEVLHGEQLNLLVVWFQLTSLRSPLWNSWWIYIV